MTTIRIGLVVCSAASSWCISCYPLSYSVKLTLLHANESTGVWSPLNPLLHVHGGPWSINNVYTTPSDEGIP